MKKLILSTLLLFTFLTTEIVKGQGNSSFDQQSAFVNISLVVQPIVTVSVISSLDFGTVLSNEGKTVTPDGVGAGQLNVESSNNTRFFLSWSTSDLSITRDGITDTVPFTLDVKGSATLDDNATLFTVDQTTQYRSFGNNNKLASIFIGADMTSTLTQSEGEYSGTITFTISDSSI